MRDTSSILINTSGTVTATTGFSGSAFNVPSGTPRRGFTVRFRLNGVYGTVASCVITPKLQVSTDGTAWIDNGIAAPITLGTVTTGTSSMFYGNVNADVQYDYIRASITGTGTGNLIGTFVGEIVPARGI